MLSVQPISDEVIHRKKNDGAGKEMKPLFLSPLSLLVKREFTVTRSQQTGNHSVAADKIIKANDSMARHATIPHRDFSVIIVNLKRHHMEFSSDLDRILESKSRKLDQYISNTIEHKK